MFISDEELVFRFHATEAMVFKASLSELQFIAQEAITNPILVTLVPEIT